MSDKSPSDDLTDNTVMAVFDDPKASQRAADDLAADGIAYDRFEGEPGREALASKEATGIFGGLVAALSDQDRVLERLKRHLDEGRSVLVVDTSQSNPTRTVEILDDRGGHDMWEFDDWTYRKVATESDDEKDDSPAQEEA